MAKVKEEPIHDYLAEETDDGTFWRRLAQMERDICIRNGDYEALAYLEEEARQRAAEAEEDEDN